MGGGKFKAIHTEGPGSKIKFYKKNKKSPIANDIIKKVNIGKF